MSKPFSAPPPVPLVAASSYLNTAPLCYSFLFGSQRDRCQFLSDAAPARCSDLLKDAVVDAALIPAIEYQRMAGLTIAPDVCVSSRTSVKSVVLVSRVPIHRVQSVALDESSRTSAALIRIILDKFYGLNPAYGSSPPRIETMLQAADAALIIGDPAMMIDRAPWHVYDLAEEWRKHTGMPFVFAFWGIRPSVGRMPGTIEAADILAGIDFSEAKREGLSNLAPITERYSSELGVPVDDLRRYLTENISFDLDAEAIAGLSEYYRLAHQAGLIAQVWDLRFRG